MFLSLLMIFDPAAGWGRAAESSRSFMRLVLLHLVPLLLLGCVAEGIGVMRWGRHVGAFGAVGFYSLEGVLRYEACHFAAGFVLVFLGALALKGLGNTFHSRHKLLQTMTASVFGLGPVFLMRLCDAFPSVNPWVSWVIGAALTAAVLYQGVPRVMHVDPSHALGVYLSSVMILVFASGAARMLMVEVLQAKILGAPLSS